MAKNTKHKKDIGKIATKIMVIALITIMLLSVGGTLIYNLIFN